MKQARKSQAKTAKPKQPNSGEETVTVIIETPKGSRNKYKFDEKMRRYMLAKVLPQGMVFPYDFGFVPDTHAEDGDPIDVLLLMDEPAFPGCVVECRLVGVIEGEQTEDGDTHRNDRLLAVAQDNHTYSDLRSIADMNQALLKEIGQFFTNYHQLQGRKFKVIGNQGPQEAMQLLQKASKKKKAA